MITFNKLNHNRAVYRTLLERELLELLDELEKHKAQPRLLKLPPRKQSKNRPK